MKINDTEYQAIGVVRFEKLGIDVPLLDIKMMSDEKWIELTSTPEQIARRKALHEKERAEYHG